MTLKNQIRLFFNASEEDGEAFQLLRNSGIYCEFLAPAFGEQCLEEIPSRPLLIVGYTKYRGIKEIKEYLKTVEN